MIKKNTTLYFCLRQLNRGGGEMSFPHTSSGFQVPSTIDRSERAGQGKLPIIHKPASSCSWVVLSLPILVAKSPCVSSTSPSEGSVQFLVKSALPVFSPPTFYCAVYQSGLSRVGVLGQTHCPHLAKALPLSHNMMPTLFAFLTLEHRKAWIHTAKLSGGCKEQPTSSLCQRIKSMLFQRPIKKKLSAGQWWHML